MNPLSKYDSVYLNYLKALMILGVVLAHSGASWAFLPYTSFFTLLPPVFFFVSGAVTFYSFERAESIQLFYKKRVIGLLVPYALLCCIVFVYYLAVNMQLPPFSMVNFAKWIQINPGAASPFSVQHVWFLQTLLLITIFAPLYFYLLNKNTKVLLLLLCAMLGVSLAQHFVDLGEMLTIGRIHVEKLITHSVFYIFGALYYTKYKTYGAKFLFLGLAGSVLMALSIVFLLGVNVDFEVHAYSPDLYFMSGGLIAIFLMLIMQAFIVKSVEFCSPVHRYILFASRNVFGIYILHVLPIYAFSYLFESGEGRVSVSQGVLRFVVALVATSIMTVPFSSISAKIVRSLLKSRQ